MKKILFIALAGLALVGCKNDNVKKQNTSNDINFATQIGITRATETTTANLEEFKVYVQEPGTNGTYQDYFNAEVTKETSTGKWTYSPVKVWKGASELRFYGYAPKDLTYTDKAIAFTPEGKAKDQKDFIVASLASPKAAKAVMPFKHALSQIIVKAKNTGDKYNVEIGGVRLTNFYNEGTLTIQEAALSKATAFSWVATTMTKKFFASSKTAVTLNAGTNDAQALDFGQNAFMVIPQDLSGTKTWDAKKKETANNQKARLSFLIRVKSADNQTLYYPAEATQMGWAACAVNTNFEAGKRYTIMLDFANGAGFQDPDNNDNGDNEFPTPPTPNPEPDHNTPVTSSNDIIFDVVVDDWVDGGDINIGL